MIKTRQQLTLLAALLAASATAAGAIDARLDTGGREWVRRDDSIRVVLDRLPQPSEGRLAVLLGAADVSDLFRIDEGVLVYRPELAPLPAGESQVHVYLVSPADEWQEIAALPLRVLGRAGFQKLELAPRLDLTSQALVDDAAGTGETGFRDGTGQLDVRGGFQRPGLGFTGQLNVLGVSAREQALRFGSEAEEAPKADLSSYRLAFTRGRAGLQIGHLSWGDSRHLIRGFSSRGVAATAPLGRWGNLSLGGMSATSIVGWDNPLGLSEGDHQVLAGTLGLELVPGRPGALRLEGTLLDGSQLPRSGFNQGNVNDREDSSGWALSLSAQALSQRFRLAGGYAESTFDNPPDPTLSQGLDVVPVESETRDGRYLDLQLDLLRNRSLAEHLPLTVTVGWQHERVEPLYRTVASSVRPDVDQDLYSLSASLGPLSARLSRSEMEDNLDDIPSVLKTLTDRDAVELAVPLAALFRVDGAAARWLPMVAFTTDRTHQRGAGIPVNSGFAASHVPDQVSRSQASSLQWQGNRWGLGYNLSRSAQDNRQPGREQADFHTRTQGVTLSLMLHSRFDLNLDWSGERARNEELLEVARTTRQSLGFNWRPTDRMTLFGTASRTEGEVEPVGSELRNDLADLQWTWRFPWELGAGHGLAPQIFVRYSWLDNAVQDPRFALFAVDSSWSVTSGLNVSIF
jgi:hypothetical protein